MVLTAHIIIALLSVVFTTYMIFAPSQAKLRASYGLVTLTLASGTYLVVNSSGHLLQACTTGLLYVGLVSIGIAMARKKLARERI